MVKLLIVGTDNNNFKQTKKFLEVNPQKIKKKNN